MNAATRPARRRIIRNLSRFSVGDAVVVEGDYNGDYYGVVVKTVNCLSLCGTRYSAPTTKPGVVVKVTRWEGVDYTGPAGSPFSPFEICAHDETARLDS